MILNIDVVNPWDEAENDSVSNESFDYDIQTPKHFVSSLMRHDSSRNLDLDSTKVMISFNSHWVLAAEVNDILNEEVAPGFRSAENFIYGAFWLVLTLIWGAINGPLVLSLPAANPYLAATWRSQCSFIFTLPILLYVYFTNRDMEIWHDILHPSKLLRISITSVFNLISMMGLILGCSMTVASHAQVLSSSTGVYVLVLLLITCKTVHKLEKYGYVIFATGVLIMLTDPFAQKPGENNEHTFGITLAFLSAGFGALAGLMSEKNSQIFHPIVFMTEMFFVFVVIQLLVFPFLQDNPLFFSLDPNFGAFGWMSNLTTFIYLEAVVVPTTNIFATLGFIKCFQYWPIEIISVGLLFRPFITEFAAVMLGQDEVPGIQTLIGLIVIWIGLFLAFNGVKEKTSTELEQLISEVNFGEEAEMHKL